MHTAKRFEFIQVTFPMECNRNMGLINTKSTAELPSDCIKVFQEARNNPTPFILVDVTQDMLRDWTSLESRYAMKCPFPTRPIREAKVNKDDTKFHCRANHYNSPWESVKNYSGNFVEAELAAGEFLYPERAYQGN